MEKLEKNLKKNQLEIVEEIIEEKPIDDLVKNQSKDSETFLFLKVNLQENHKFTAF